MAGVSGTKTANINTKTPQSYSRGGARQVFRTHLQSASSEEYAGTGDGLGLESHKHIRPQAVVHVVPTMAKHRQTNIASSLHQGASSPPDDTNSNRTSVWVATLQLLEPSKLVQCSGWVRFNFVHFSLGHPQELLHGHRIQTKTKKDEDTNGERSTESLPETTLPHRDLGASTVVEMKTMTCYVRREGGWLEAGPHAGSDEDIRCGCSSNGQIIGSGR